MKTAMTIRLTLLACMVVCTLPACSPAPEEQLSHEHASGPPVVFVVNYPLKYFAERIGGDEVIVTFPAPTDADPAYWRPDDDTVRAYQAADLILRNGAGYAKWMAAVSLPDAKVVDTSAAFADQLIEIEDGVVHQHGPGGEHSHRGTAFTTWLDPRLAIQQAQAIAAALQQRYPENAEQFEAGLRSLTDDLRQLDEQLTEANQHYAGQTLLASHPVYQYLARRCDWNLKSLHWEPSEVPEEDEWQKLSQWQQSEPSAAGWMIWEDEPRAETHERLKAMGIGCVVFRPCGNTPATGDYLTVMKSNIDALELVLSTLKPAEPNKTRPAETQQEASP